MVLESYGNYCIGGSVYYMFVYFLKASKCWLIVKPNMINIAGEIFKDKHFGTAVGSSNFKTHS